MDIRINSSPITYSGHRNVKNNTDKEDVSLNNDNKNFRYSNPVRDIVYASMLMAALGLGYCSNNQKDANNEPQVETVESLGRYSEDIDKFMDDKNICKVNTTDSVQQDCEKEHRVIYSRGYDKNGKLIKSVAIHPMDSTQTYMENPNLCKESEVKFTTYYKDRKETEEYCYGEFMKKEIKYNKPVSVDGVSGYSKTEIKSADGCRTEIYRKALYEPANGAKVRVSDKYNERVVIYDENNKKLETINLKTNKNGVLLPREIHSDLPEDY